MTQASKVQIEPLSDLMGAEVRGVDTSQPLGGSVLSALQQAMLDRRYDLQSLLYSLALHRFLAQRITGYDFEQHFGGSYYLFLRAMRPEHGARFGIHFERPRKDTIEQLDQLLKFTPAEAASL